MVADATCSIRLSSITTLDSNLDSVVGRSVLATDTSLCFSDAKNFTCLQCNYYLSFLFVFVSRGMNCKC
jgi:hypothetical protein